MAKKKRKRPRRLPADGGAPSEGRAAGAAAPERRSRKQEARRMREAERRRATRAAAVRRAVRVAVVVALAAGVFSLVTQLGGANDIPEDAVRAAADAGCSEVTQPVTNPERGHLSSGESFTYQQHPATSGRHDPSALAAQPHVYASVDDYSETMAVHALEHAAVMLYYRPEGAAATPQPVVEALSRVANGSRYSILAPHPSLPEGTSIALAAWNRVQTCPSTITADQAVTVARGFIEAFECTNNAPENGATSGSC